MDTESSRARSAFAWNFGGWLGLQLGGTLWLLILGLVLFRKDVAAAWLCLASLLVLNGWGVYLWRSRERLNAYAGVQRFLLGASAVVGLVVIVVNHRGLSKAPGPGALVSTYLPYWTIAAAPALMVMFFLQERRSKRR